MDKSQAVPYVPPNTVIWDCGSSLYDSFELNSFNRQLDTAIATRSFSMPHVIYDNPVTKTKKKGKINFISKPLQKLFRSMFNTKSRSSQRQSAKNEDHDDTTAIHDAGFLNKKLITSSPDLNPMVRKTRSERLSYRSAVAPPATKYGTVEFR